MWSVACVTKGFLRLTRRVRSPLSDDGSIAESGGIDRRADVAALRQRPRAQQRHRNWIFLLFFLATRHFSLMAFISSSTSLSASDARLAT